MLVFLPFNNTLFKTHVFHFPPYDVNEWNPFLINVCRFNWNITSARKVAWFLCNSVHGTKWMCEFRSWNLLENMATKKRKWNRKTINQLVEFIAKFVKQRIFKFFFLSKNYLYSWQACVCVCVCVFVGGRRAREGIQRFQGMYFSKISSIRTWMLPAIGTTTPSGLHQVRHNLLSNFRFRGVFKFQLWKIFLLGLLQARAKEYFAFRICIAIIVQYQRFQTNFRIETFNEKSTWLPPILLFVNSFLEF